MPDSIAVVLLAVIVLGLVWFRTRLEGYLRRPGPARRLGGTWLGLATFASICLAGFAFCAYNVGGALISGTIHCFGRRCDGSYSLTVSPAAYWLAVAIWSAAAIFFLWITLHGVRRFIRLRAGEA